MATFIVDTLADVVDATDGRTSLREAITAASARAGGDRITFDATLLPGSGSSVPQGLLLVAGELVISGAGGRLTIDGDLDDDGQADIALDAGNASRVIAADGRLALEGLVITGGRVEADIAIGGGIAADILTLRDCVVTGNEALGRTARGGGVYATTLRLRGTEVSSNRAEDELDTRADTFTEGGGIFATRAIVRQSGILDNDAINDNASFANARGGGLAVDELWLVNSRVEGNRATADDGTDGEVAFGGGIDAVALVVVGSVVTGNFASGNRGLGGGAFAQTATIERSTFLSNSVNGSEGTSSGGGLYAREATVERSEFRGNAAFASSGVSGGGLGVGALAISNSLVMDNFVQIRTGNSREESGGGGISANSVDARHTMVSGNRVENDADEGRATGGGIDAVTVSFVGGSIAENLVSGYRTYGGGLAAIDATLRGSTVSGNLLVGPYSRGNPSTGYYARGGGIFASGTASVANGTIAGNRAEAEYALGGGIHAGVLTMTHGTVTANVAEGSPLPFRFGTGGGIFLGDPGAIIRNSLVIGNAASDATGADLAGAGAEFVASLIGGDAATVFAATVVVEVNGLLLIGGAIAANGGPTETAALRNADNNPAVDAGDPLFGLPADQRGVPRDGVPDLGAFELEPATVTAAAPDALWGAS